MDKENLFEEVTRNLADNGQVVAVGWASFCGVVLPPTVSKIQHDEMRLAFFSGAYHLFNSVMAMLSSGQEATDDDMRRMDAIRDELDRFCMDELVQRIGIPTSKAKQ